MDYAAAALSHLLLAPSLRHRRYHISAGIDSAVNWQEISLTFSALQDKSLIRKYCTVETADITEELIRATLGDGPARRLKHAIELYFRFGRLNVVFDNKRLLSEGMPPPPTFISYLPVCMTTSAHRPIYEQMIDD